MKFDDHFLSWSLIYMVAYVVAKALLSILALPNVFWSLILVGFVFTLISWIMYSILYKNRFTINKLFFIWILAHAFTYWLLGFLLGLFTVITGLIFLLFFGILYHILTHLIKLKIFNKIRDRRNYWIIVVVIYLLLLFLLNLYTGQTSQTNETINPSSNNSGGIWKSLSGLFNNNKTQEISVKELTQNPDAYLEKEIIVSGKVSTSGGCGSLVATNSIWDSNGYNIKMDLRGIADPAFGSKHNFLGTWKKTGDCYFLAVKDVS